MMERERETFIIEISSNDIKSIEIDTFRNVQNYKFPKQLLLACTDSLRWKSLHTVNTTHNI